MNCWYQNGSYCHELIFLLPRPERDSLRRHATAVTTVTVTTGIWPGHSTRESHRPSITSYQINSWLIWEITALLSSCTTIYKLNLKEYLNCNILHEHKNFIKSLGSDMRWYGKPSPCNSKYIEAPITPSAAGEREGRKEGKYTDLLLTDAPTNV